MRIKILGELSKLSEEKYRDFSIKLLPKGTMLLGVRIPLLRKKAKEMLKTGEGEQYLGIEPGLFCYQEELMLYGMILAMIKWPYAKKESYLKRFVCYINSWAVCDIFCADLKEVKKMPQFFYQQFLIYRDCANEYMIRFFYVMALNYFLVPELSEKVLALIKEQKYVGFYDKMAVAWCLSVAYVKNPERVETFLLTEELDDFVFKKTISKIGDSYRIKKEVKTRLRALSLKKLH